jgi:diguanylate cyclase (GGDEF)-like protein
MKINPKAPIDIAAMRAIQRATATGGAREAAASGRAGPVRAIADRATVLGIPEAEFTPKVRDAIMTLMAEVDALRRDLRVSEARIRSLEQLADEDALAPIANRRAFVRELSRAMSFAERYGRPSAVLYFDLDGLKRINDAFGHAAGDAALLHVARVLEANIRDTDTVGRIGGDEFGVILAQADEAQAIEKGTALAQAIARAPLSWQGKALQLSVSWGSHAFQSVGDPAHALDAADRQMYLRKKALAARA